MDRQREQADYQKMVNHAKEYEQLIKEQDTMNKKMLGEEYKHMMDQKFQVNKNHCKPLLINGKIEYDLSKESIKRNGISIFSQ